MICRIVPKYNPNAVLDEKKVYHKFIYKSLKASCKHHVSSKKHLYIVHWIGHNFFSTYTLVEIVPVQTSLLSKIGLYI